MCATETTIRDCYVCSCSSLATKLAFIFASPLHARCHRVCSFRRSCVFRLRLSTGARVWSCSLICMVPSNATPLESEARPFRHIYSKCCCVRHSIELTTMLSACWFSTKYVYKMYIYTYQLVVGRDDDDGGGLWDCECGHHIRTKARGTNRVQSYTFIRILHFHIVDTHCSRFLFSLLFSILFSCRDFGMRWPCLCACPLALYAFNNRKIVLYRFENIWLETYLYLRKYKWIET